ncbi:helix-turn-helix domain-containing protein [Enterococcus saccharolyticus]|uniref:PucR family transcriptional regulator n=1 Tax=Enterococcus saccharolyticus TaxID=41997 RepID=UPI0009DB77B1|nr:helix-turn-helix domain-containing protein [Enterococcus saccharolyticus]
MLFLLQISIVIAFVFRFFSIFHYLAATSRLLFIHRNTLLYRIEKIETLLGYSLTTPSVAFNLAFALKLHKQYPKT